MVIETVTAAFTDHFAVALRIARDSPIVSRGKCYWRMNTSLLNDATFKHVIQTHWKKWQTRKKYYPNTVMWWELCVKPMIWHLFTREGTEQKDDRIILENLYYNAIYNILNEPTNHETTAITLKHLKAKITRLHHAELRRILLDIGEQDVLGGEEPSIYHIPKARKRQVARMVIKIQIILRMDPKYIPTEWLLRPTLKLWPPQRHRAVLWTLANFVEYRLHQRRTLTLQDYLDFLRRAKWKIYSTRNRTSIVGTI